jgi:sulfonate transport system substrate-binding protein
MVRDPADRKGGIVVLVDPGLNRQRRWLARGLASAAGAVMFVAPLLALVLIWAIAVPLFGKNGETIEKFLAGVSEADQWMRKNPKQAAQIATRWIPGLKPEIAEAAMQFNIQQADRRLSANNYRALWSAEDRLNRLGILKTTFDVNKHIEPKHILKVMKDNPELFADLPPIPADAAIGPGFVFKP